MMRFHMRSAPLKSPFQWDPGHEIDALRRALESVGERSVERVPAGTVGLGFVPRADLYDVGAAFMVRVDLPGVKEGNPEIIGRFWLLGALALALYALRYGGAGRPRSSPEVFGGACRRNVRNSGRHGLRR